MEYLTKKVEKGHANGQVIVRVAVATSKAFQFYVHLAVRVLAQVTASIPHSNLVFSLKVKGHPKDVYV